MAGLWGRLFGAPDALNTIVKEASDGIGALVYTDQEKADDAAEERKRAREMVVGWMQATQGQNLARRIIALSITAVWLAMYLLGAVAKVAAVWWTDRTVQLNETADLFRGFASDMSSAVMLILAFYFAAPHMGDIASAAIKRFQSRTEPPNRTG